MDKKKIGLVLAFKGTNYGMHLQGYATQQLLDSWGYETEIIDYSAKGLLNGIPIQRGLLTFLGKMLYERLFHKKKIVEWSDKHLENNRKRKKVSDYFRVHRLHSIVQIEGTSALKKYASECGAILIGSDQMWIPGVSFGNFLSLRFVPDNIKKISYATSLGVSEYPRYCYASARAMWQRFNHLSTREEEGMKVITDICPNLSVKVVADPTYLLTKEEWLEKIPYREIKKDKYLLCYFLGNKDSSKLCARRYADKHGLKLISIVSNESMSEIDFSYCDEAIVGASVEDFVNLIRGAGCIFTDSFHGLAFSVINEKQFYVFYRKRDDVKQSRNSRIDNILRTWGVSNRLVCDEGVLWNEKDDYINYDKVNIKLQAFREASLHWLHNAIIG